MRDGLGRVQSILLLGGDSDVGVAIATRLVERGARDIFLAGRHADRLEVRADQLRQAGAARVETGFFDADDVDSHEDFLSRAFTAFGRIDVVVVAFGVLGDTAVAAHDAAAAAAIARTNYLGAASVLVGAAERLRAQGQGAVILLSSVAAQRPRRSNFVYGASKAGIDALAEGLAFLLRDEGVQVLTVRPGFIETKMTKGMKATPFKTTAPAVAAAAVNALERGGELIWVPGTLRYVMWVIRLIPRPIFRRLPI